MPSIGSIRVDFLADVTQFVSGVNKASVGMSRFANEVAKNIHSIEKTMQKLGTGMTLKVTAPIAAFSYAAVKAADVNGKAMAEMTATAERAHKAIAPVGREIIRAFEAAKPTIDRIITGTETLFKRFEQLPTPTKDMILKAVALTAALGPLALGLSVVAKVAGTAIMPITGTLNAIAVLTSGVTSLSAAMNTGKVAAWFAEFKNGHPQIIGTVKGLAVLATAAAAFEAGSWIGKQPFILNANVFLIESLTSAYRNFFSFIEERLLRMKGMILKNFGDMITSVAGAGKSLAKLDPTGAMSGVFGGAQGLGQQMASTGQQDLTKSYMMRFKYLQDHLSRVAPSLNSIISGPAFGPGPIESVKQDWQTIIDKIDAIFKKGPAAAEASTASFEEWNRTIIETKSGLEDLGKLAMSMNEKYTPEIKKLGKQLFDLDMMSMNGMVGRNGLISTDNWKRAREDILSEIEKINTAAAEMSQKAFGESFKTYQSAVDQVKGQYLQAYPEVSYNADIERLNALMAQFQEIGDFQTSGMVQAIIDDKELDKAREATKKIVEGYRSANEQMKALKDETKKHYEDSFGGKLDKSITNFSANVGQAFADMAKNGKFAFDDLASSFASMLISMAAQEAFSPIFKMFGSAIGGLFTPSTEFNGPPAPGLLQAHASGGITNRPIFTRGHLAGEAGREVIAPLSQLPELLSRMGMGGGTTFQVIDQRGGGAPVQMRENRGPDGRRIITAIIKDALAGGELDSAMSQRFNARPNPR